MEVRDHQTSAQRAAKHWNALVVNEGTVYNLSLSPLSCCFGFQICDLGSARRLNQTVKQTTAIGTYAWMAPEVGASNHISPG